MKYVTTSHRNGLDFFNISREYQALWDEIDAAITNVSDDRIIDWFETHSAGKSKSISIALNALIKQEFIEFGWKHESFIFAESDYRESNWRLDFAKDEISVEVGFNHGEAVAWNLIKPVLASELNHVTKDIQTSAGVVICATEALKQAGGFDSAVGSYEKYVQYLKPLQNLLSVPMVIIGLEPPQNFVIDHKQIGNKKLGSVRKL